MTCSGKIHDREAAHTKQLSLHTNLLLCMIESLRTPTAFYQTAGLLSNADFGNYRNMPQLLEQIGFLWFIHAELSHGKKTASL